MDARSILPAALLFASCFLGSVLMGLAFYGRVVFDAHLAYFQFVAAGAMGGGLTVAAAGCKSRSMIIAAMLAFAALLAWDSPKSWNLLLRDAVWVLVLVLAVRIGVWNSRVLPRLVFGKFVLWAAVFGALHMGMFAILTLANGISFASDSAMLAGRLGALVGAGLGLGYEVAVLAGWPIGPVHAPGKSNDWRPKSPRKDAP